MTHSARIGLALLAVFSVAVHVAVLHQGPHWTSPLLMGDHLFDLLFTLTLLWFGLALGRKVCAPLLALDTDQLSEQLAALGLGLGMLSLGILTLGFLRLYYGPVVLAAGLILSIWLRSELGALLDEAGVAIQRWRRTGMPSAPSKGQRVVLLLLALTCIPVCVRALLPVNEWDAVVYHLTGPKLYIAAHSIVPLPDVPLANAPSGEEMLFIPGLLAGTDGIGKLLNLSFALLVGLSIYAFCRRRGEPAAGWLGLLLFFSPLWLAPVMPLTLTDFASAFLLVAGVNDACAWLDLRTKNRPATRTNRLLLRAGMLIGLAVSYKLTSIPAIPALTVSIGVMCLLLPGRGILGRMLLAISSGLSIGVCSLLLLSPWLLKNLYFFGRPLYPAGGVAVSNPSHGTSVAAVSPPPFEHLRWIATSYGDFLFNHLSPFVVLLLLAPLVLRRPSEWAALLFLATGTLLWLLFVPFFEPPRYYLGLAALWQAMTGLAIYRLMALLRLHAFEFVVVAFLLYRLLFGLFVEFHAIANATMPAVVQGTLSRYNYLAGSVRPFLAEDYANNQLQIGSPIAMVNVQPGYYMNRPYLNDWYGQRLSALEQNETTRLAELATWCRVGVRFAIFDRGDNYQTLDPPQPRSRYIWLHQAGLNATVVLSANGVDVLTVQPCKARPGALSHNTRS